MRVSTRGLVSMQDAHFYCGISGKTKIYSMSMKIILEFTAKARSSARFKCTMYVIPDDCQCGVSNRKSAEKVVGGVPVSICGVF